LIVFSHSPVEVGIGIEPNDLLEKRGGDRHVGGSSLAFFRREASVYIFKTVWQIGSAEGRRASACSTNYRATLRQRWLTHY
jgi:hypothetical protein